MVFVEQEKQDIPVSTYPGSFWASFAYSLLTQPCSFLHALSSSWSWRMYPSSPSYVSSA